MKLNLRGVDLNLLTVFDAIMSEGNLSNAAQRLGMTQSAASAALSRLRLTFDDELFIRTRQGMVPTPVAEELIRPVREGLESIEEALGISRHFDPATSDRTFKLVMGDFGEILLLPSLVAELGVVSEKLSIQTFSDRDIKNIELAKKSQLDFFFDYRLPQESHLDHCLLTEDRLVVVAKKSHPSIQQTLSREQFLSARHLIYTHHHHHVGGLESMFGSDQGINRNVMAEVQQVLAIPELVMQTDGIATVPRRLAEYFMRHHPLMVFDFPFDVGPIPAYMVWHRSLNRDKGHRWMKQKILEMVSLT